MESLPLELVSFIQQMRPLFRVEVFESFCYLLTGILMGEVKQGTVRASVFAPRITGHNGYPTCFVVTKSLTRPSWRSWLR